MAKRQYNASVSLLCAMCQSIELKISHMYLMNIIVCLTICLKTFNWTFNIVPCILNVDIQLSTQLNVDDIDDIILLYNYIHFFALGTIFPELL